MRFSGALGHRALVAAGLLAVTSSGWAASGFRLLLVKEGDTASCVEERALRSAVTSRLGYDPFLGDAQGTVLLRLSRRENQLVCSVELVDESGASRGKRELNSDAASCGEMTRAMALSISIAIDPEHVSEEPPLETAALPAEPPASADPTPAAPAVAAPPPSQLEPSKPAASSPPAPQPGKQEAFTASGSLTGASLFGVAPLPSLGLGLELEAKRGRWSIGVGGRVTRAPGATVEQGATLHVTLATGQLAACFQDGLLEYCALAEAGRTWVQATGVAHPGADAGLFGAAGGRVSLEAPLSGSVSLLLQGEAVGVFRPIRPQIDGATVVWSAPPVAGALAIGFRTRFW